MVAVRAAWYERAGPAAEVLTVGEMPTPAPAPGEVLVRVHTSGVNPSDVKLRAGGRPGMDGLPWPRIVPHSDGAGVIEAVGAGVDPARIGTRVWLWNGQWERASGTCAEYIALPSIQAVPLPEAASFEAGACMGIPATTAAACVYSDGALDGRILLVTGGAGAVSSYAIQMARAGGATVFTTVSGPEKAEHARRMGADHVLNYREDDLVEAIRDLTGGYGIDRAIDLEFGANIAAVAELIRPQGIITAYGSAAVREPALPFYTLMFKRVTLRTELVYILPPEARAAVVTRLTAHLSGDDLIHTIAARFPLAQIAEAHELVESGGKVGCVTATF